MAVGDMKYKFTDNTNTEVEIMVPANVLRRGKRAGLTNRETIMKYAFENGYNVDKPAETKKATAKKGAAKRTRKPNDTKLQLMQTLQEALAGVGETNVVNPERQLQVTIDGKIFEFTLVQKRAPKN